jgi:hypothetical protein
MKIDKKSRDMITVGLLMLVIVFSWWQIIELSLLKNYVLSIGDISPRVANKMIAAVDTDPLNATYLIDEKQITLRNGMAEAPVAPGSAAKEVVRVFGTPQKGDLDGDGIDDYAMLISQETGGSGTFYYVAVGLVDKSLGKVLGTNSILLGDRIAPKNISISNGLIVVNYADRKTGEPMSTQPSVGVTKTFRIKS